VKAKGVNRAASMSVTGAAGGRSPWSASTPLGAEGRTCDGAIAVGAMVVELVIGAAVVVVEVVVVEVVVGGTVVVDVVVLVVVVLVDVGATVVVVDVVVVDVVVVLVVVVVVARGSGSAIMAPTQPKCSVEASHCDAATWVQSSSSPTVTSIRFTSGSPGWVTKPIHRVVWLPQARGSVAVIDPPHCAIVGFGPMLAGTGPSHSTVLSSAMSFT